MDTFIFILFFATPAFPVIIHYMLSRIFFPHSPGSIIDIDLNVCSIKSWISYNPLRYDLLTQLSSRIASMQAMPIITSHLSMASLFRSSPANRISSCGTLKKSNQFLRVISGIHIISHVCHFSSVMYFLYLGISNLYGPNYKNCTLIHWELPLFMPCPQMYTLAHLTPNGIHDF